MSLLDAVSDSWVVDLDTMNRREKVSVPRRAERVRRLEEPVGNATRVFAEIAQRPRSALVTTGQLRVRSAFSYRSEPAPDVSDRKVPDVRHRPPATQLVSPNGAALRLELVALGFAQGRHPHGASAARHGLPLRASSGSYGWTSLLASPAEHSKAKNQRTTALDKRVRQLQTTLKTLHARGLVDLPNISAPRAQCEDFVLLNEDAGDGRLPYTVPTLRQPSFTLPASFITRGWVHLLEDAEIALLLMVACGRGTIPADGGMVAVPGEIRLQHYGINRDSFTSAHRMLDRFGLLEVEEVGRWHDGKAENHEEDGAYLHRLRLQPDGFEQDAFTVVEEAVERLIRTQH